MNATLQPSTVSLSYEEAVITDRGGAPAIAYQLALPDEARAAVLLIHGYGEHKARYRRVVESWSLQGLAVASFDLRGHGWSEGRRGYIDRFSDYLDDATDVLKALDARTKGKPLFVFGHSLGGLIATTYVLSNQARVRGLVLSSPYFGLAFKVPQAKKIAGRVFSRLVPWLGLPTGLSGTDVTHDPELARQYDIDPRVNKVATARWFTEASGAQDAVMERAAELNVPLLCVAGGADHVASTPIARQVFERVASRDKTFDEKAGLYHEVLNEPEGMKIAAEMSRWILAHV
jgi:alpha-beta hydrolase superfamily lysophospholipase